MGRFVNNGLFLVFEGGEGSGKSTQARMLSDALTERNVPNILTREPGDTELGEKLRSILLDREGVVISRKSEALLFAADRAQHAEKVLRPGLQDGLVVICDRYIASSIAYQAHANSLDEDVVGSISYWAVDGLFPDVTFLLDVRPYIGVERAKRVERTRFEDKPYEHHSTVRQSFLNQRNGSWVTLDAEESIDEVHGKILHHTLRIVQGMKQYRDLIPEVEVDVGDG